MSVRSQLLAVAFLSVAVSAPAWAGYIDLRPVAAQDVSQFVGMEVHGAAYADLGVVSDADPYLGLIGITGKHGEFATLHASLLRRDGLQMFAPRLTVGDLRRISLDQWSTINSVAIARPTITIEERPYSEEPADQLPLQ